MDLEDKIANIEDLIVLKEFEKLIPVIFAVIVIGVITEMLMDFEPTKKELIKEVFINNNPKQWLYIKKA